MKRDTTLCDTLNRLFAIHYRSLPVYLLWAMPYRQAGDEHSWETIQDINRDQQEICGRLVELIAQRNCRIDYGDFPITFTGAHDLSLSYLVRRLVDWQRDTVTAINDCYLALANDPTAQALADEALGAAKGHLESLEEVVAGKGKPSATTLTLHAPVVAE